MKLSKTGWLLIASGVFIITLASLGAVYSRQVDDQNQLNEKLALTQSNLRRIQIEKLSSRQAELESQLSQATSQFEAVKVMLSQPIGSAAIASILFDIAQAHGVEVTGMTSSRIASENLKGVTCSVISLTAKVEGDVSNLVSFVTNLNEQFATGVVKSVAITIPETASGDNATASIQLVVYSYRGD